jgi:hypothetical protein
MSGDDLLGLALVAVLGVVTAWWGLHTLRRAAPALRARNLAALARAFGPAVAAGAQPPPGRWHRVLQESHRPTTERDHGPVVLFSELVVVDQDGQHWHCKLRCDEKTDPAPPELTRLDAATAGSTATFTATWKR